MTDKFAVARRPGELVFAGAALASSLFLFWNAYRISGFSALSAPGALPIAATGLMVLASAVVLVRTALAPAAEDGFRRFRSEVASAVVALFSSLVLIYGAMLQSIGFLISSFVFLAVAIMVLRGRWALSAIGYAALSVAVVYVIFRLVFQVVLPEGIVPERRIIADVERIVSGVLGR